MFQIPEKYFCNMTVHRNISSDQYNGILSCGFLNKKTSKNSDIDITFDYYGALLLLSGEGIHIDNEGREYKLYPGCFIQRIPGKPHSTYVYPNGEWLEFFICFGKELFEALTHVNILDNSKDILYPGLNMAIFDTFVQFMSSLKDSSHDNLPFMLAEAQRIIMTIYSMHMKNTTDDENIKIIKQACLLLTSDYTRHISSREVAYKLDIGFEKFRKLFKEKMGISPGDYRIQERINKAKTMLIDSNRSIKEISLELCFCDSVSFSKQFKKVVGTSPSEFKRKY